MAEMRTLFIVLVVLVLLDLILWFIVPEQRNKFGNGKQLHKMTGDLAKHQCTTSCSKLDPVSEPEYNMKEVIQQTVLLEDHLTHKNKRCRDCILKHYNMICGLLSEAVWLATDHIQDYPLLETSVGFYNDSFDKWLNNYYNEEEVLHIASELRDMRKKLSAVYYFGKEKINII